jgi:hypothetical protein
MSSVFVASKVHDAEIWLPRFIREVENLEGNISRIALMYGESKDETFSLLKHWQATSKHPIEIFADPYLPEEERHGHTLARIKRDVQELLKAGKEEWYLNLDCDLVQIPRDLIPRLMGRDKDTIAAMVWTENRKQKTFFDVYIFRKDGCMFDPYEPPGLGQTEPFTVDAVSTCYLAKREVELAGTYTNPYPPIMFYESLRQKGFKTWVDPSVDVYHVDLEAYGILHQPQPHPFSYVPFIKNTGEKVAAPGVGAARFQIDRDNYNAWVEQNLPERHRDIKAWLDSRPLITASVKAFNSALFLKEFLTGLYPWVDRIDVVEGAVKTRLHEANGDGSSKDGTVKIIKEFPDPDKKIKLVQGKWESKEHAQAKLLEMCVGRWMLFIDSDEFLTAEAWLKVRRFCEEHTDGRMVFARPHQFLHFFHDWKHIAYSVNPLSPWFQYGVPHPSLIWRDVPGLNFAQFHTLPMDGFGYGLWTDSALYRGRQTILDGVLVYHFGNAISKEAMREKLLYEYRRGGKSDEVGSDMWFTGIMPPDMVIEDYKGDYPDVLSNHPEKDKARIKVTEVKPVYRFDFAEES